MPQIKAIIVNEPVSSTPQTWELTEDPGFKYGDQFKVDTTLYEIRRVFPVELELMAGMYSPKPRIYHSFPMPV